MEPVSKREGRKQMPTMPKDRIPECPSHNPDTSEGTDVRHKQRNHIVPIPPQILDREISPQESIGILLVDGIQQSRTI